MESIFFCRQQKYTAKQDPWTGCGPYLGQSPTHLQSEADLPATMQGSGSLSDEPICALMDSVTSTYSIARVDSLGGDEDG
jgi:hypothetical protein